jgi:hypothetical protein
MNTAHMDTVRSVTVYTAALNLNHMADMLLYTSYRVRYIMGGWCNGQVVWLKVPHSTFPDNGTGILLLLLLLSHIYTYYSFDYTLRLFNSLSDR